MHARVRCVLAQIKQINVRECYRKHQTNVSTYQSYVLLGVLFAQMLPNQFLRSLLPLVVWEEFASSETEVG